MFLRWDDPELVALGTAAVAGLDQAAQDLRRLQVRAPVLARCGLQYPRVLMNALL